MASAGSIFVDLLLRDARYREGLNRARSSTKSTFGAIQGDLNKTQSAFNGVLNPVNSLATAIGRLGGALAGALSVQKIVQYSDTWKQLQGRLSIVEADMMAVGAAQENLFEIAQRNRQPLEGVISFYQRLNQFIPEAERNQYDLLAVTERVTAALAITGETGASASAAMIQFTQAIGTNFEAAGQELRSIQEQAPRLAQALRNSFGDGTKSLQQLKEEGVLTRDSVLRALSGVGEEGKKLAEELAKIPVTVGQAFTKLNNAFLKFVGQSESISSGTNVLASSISFLAENFNLLANAVTIVAAVYGGKFVGSIVLSTTALVNQSVAATAAATRISAVSGVVAAATVTQTLFAGAVTAASTALRFLGGPVGLAVTALIAFSATSSSTSDDLDDLEPRAQSFIESLNGITLSSEQAAAAMKNELAVAIAEIQEQLSKEQTKIGFKKALLGGFADPTTENFEELTKELARKEALLKRLNEPISAPKISEKDSEEAAKELAKAQSELGSLYERNKSLLTGLSDETLRYMETQEELLQLEAAGKISKDQLIMAVQRLDEEFAKSQEVANEWGIDLSEIGKTAANNIRDAFADFLFDPFAEGTDGMLENFVTMLRKMAAQALANNIMGSLFGGGSSAGLLGGLMGSSGWLNPDTGSIAAGSGSGLLGLFGGFFADGGYLQPGQWGVAGENGPELIYGGASGMSVTPNSGGNTYNIDARGADMAAITRLETALISLAGPGVIEQRVSNAQVRGAL